MTGPTAAQTIPRHDPIALLRQLVQIDSRNPTLASDGPGEGAVAASLAATLAAWGFRVEQQEVFDGRPNVIARIGAAKSGRTLMLNGHLDVVGIKGMTHPAFDAEEHGGRLYGRGSADMKAGIAAMCAAAGRAGSTIDGEIIVAAVIDEEHESAGTRALLSSGVVADAAIIPEPTGLAICPAHRGFAWVEIIVRGRAAHGSRHEIGIDAIRHAGLLLAELDRIDAEKLPQRSHRLLGRPSLHASFIKGGLGMSTYPDRCVLTIERRTIPGEEPGTALDEIRAACDRVRSSRPTFTADTRLIFEQRPSDVPEDTHIVEVLAGALKWTGRSARIEGLSAWTDAALLNAAGIPTVCFGPGDIALAHAAEEFVPLAEVTAATEVLEATIRRWFTDDGRQVSI